MAKKRKAYSFQNGLTAKKPTTPPQKPFHEPAAASVISSSIMLTTDYAGSRAGVSVAGLQISNVSDLQPSDSQSRT